MIKGAVLALILLASSPACGQYVRNGELVGSGAPPEDADRERLILARRKRKYDDNERRRTEGGVRFSSKAEPVDPSLIRDHITRVRDSGAGDVLTFDARRARQIAREADVLVSYRPDAATGGGWGSLVMYWVLSAVLVAAIYAYCNSPMAKYLKKQPKPPAPTKTTKKSRRRAAQKVEPSATGDGAVAGASPSASV